MLYGEASSPWRHTDEVGAIVCLFLYLYASLSRKVLCMEKEGGGTLSVVTIYISHEILMLGFHGRLFRAIIPLCADNGGEKRPSS